MGLNQGLSTLQFQSLSVSPFNVNVVQGGTQDNGTWQTPGNPVKWENTMIGDGGQSGFDAANPAFRFHTFFGASPDVNFADGDIADWNWIADQIYFGGEPPSFYVPIISDPVVSRSMFAGLGHVWRTKTWGMGTPDLGDFPPALQRVVRAAVRRLLRGLAATRRHILRAAAVPVPDEPRHLFGDASHCVRGALRNGSRGRLRRDGRTH